MKYLVSMAFLLALFGCAGNPPGSQNSSNGSESLSYLDKPLKGRVSQHGLYRMVRSGGLVKDPNTSTGKAVSKPVVQRVKSTERIPLIKGAQMYLQYRIWPIPARPAYVDIRRVLKHPEMKLPDGSVSTGSDYMMKGKVSSNQLIVFTGYGLDEDYELVEGDWIFEIWYEGKKMIEQKFTTYWPDKEEIATLTPILMLGNKVVGQDPPPRKFSRSNWPRIVVGGKKSPEATESLNEPSGSTN